MRCPSCGDDNTAVVGLQVEQGPDGYVRRRRCMACGLEFETVEQVRSVVRMQAFQACLWRAVGASSGGG